MPICIVIFQKLIFQQLNYIFCYLLFQDPRIVSDRNLAVLVRQVALHCNLAANMQRSGQASNWLERMKAIKRIREKVIKVNTIIYLFRETDD